MVNKRGYIRIIEAVIAVVIIFGYIVSILPKEEPPTGKIPPELDNTIQALLKQIENSPEFRNEVMYQHNKQEIATQIDRSLPPFSPWRYAFKLCKAGETNVDACGFYVKADNPDTAGEEESFIPTTNAELLNIFASRETAIYTKALFLSEADITAPDIGVAPPCTPSSSPTGSDSCKNLVLTFYMWSQV